MFGGVGFVVSSVGLSQAVIRQQIGKQKKQKANL